MPRILVFQHVAHEILGTLNPLLKSAGFRIRYVNFGREPNAEPSLAGYDGLIVLGGPMNVDQVEEFVHLRTEVRLIQEALEREIPILGVCLGAQLIARALGAAVGPAVEKEIGWYDLTLTEAGRNDPLLESLATMHRVFQWHGDTFAIPQGAENLASSSRCPHQAFRYGDRVYGLQFHLEVDEALIRQWLNVEANQREIASMQGATDAATILRDTQSHVEESCRLAEGTFGAWIRLLGPGKRGLGFASR